MEGRDTMQTLDEIDAQLAEVRQELDAKRVLARQRRDRALRAEVAELEDKLAEAEGLQRLLRRALA